MFPRRPQEGTTSSIPFSSPSPILVLLLLLTSPPPSLAESPPLLSLLVPWAAEGAPGAAGVGGALETLGEAPYLSTPGDERRLQAFLESDRMQGLTGGPAAPEDWESPKNPDLFLLTEVGGGSEEGRRRRNANDQEEVPHGSETHRMKRNGGFVSGGSRIRTGGNGGGYVGSSGMRVGSGFGSFGPGRMGGGQVGGRMSEGPSLSIVNPLDVLRQRLLLEIARRRMRESEDQIQANRELLKSIGKREVGVGREEGASGGGGPGKDKAHAQTPSSM